MLHILLVEDNPADVLLIREAIRTSTVEADVLVAYDGEQALRMLRHQDLKPDFVILDINLPRFNGFQILERYHVEKAPPIVVFTGSDKLDDRLRAVDLGVREYVVKPSDPVAFQDAIQHAIRRWMPDSTATENGG